MAQINSIDNDQKSSLIAQKAQLQREKTVLDKSVRNWTLAYYADVALALPLIVAGSIAGCAPQKPDGSFVPETPGPNPPHDIDTASLPVTDSRGEPLYTEDGGAKVGSIEIKSGGMNGDGMPVPTLGYVFGGQFYALREKPNMNTYTSANLEPEIALYAADGVMGKNGVPVQKADVTGKLAAVVHPDAEAVLYEDDSTPLNSDFWVRIDTVDLRSVIRTFGGDNSWQDFFEPSNKDFNFDPAVTAEMINEEVKDGAKRDFLVSALQNGGPVNLDSITAVFGTDTTWQNYLTGLDKHFLIFKESTSLRSFDSIPEPTKKAFLVGKFEKAQVAVSDMDVNAPNFPLTGAGAEHFVNNGITLEAPYFSNESYGWKIFITADKDLFSGRTGNFLPDTNLSSLSWVAYLPALSQAGVPKPFYLQKFEGMSDPNAFNDMTVMQKDQSSEEKKSFVNTVTPEAIASLGEVPGQTAAAVPADGRTYYNLDREDAANYPNGLEIKDRKFGALLYQAPGGDESHRTQFICLLLWAKFPRYTEISGTKQSGNTDSNAATVRVDFYMQNTPLEK